MRSHYNLGGGGISSVYTSPYTKSSSTTTSRLQTSETWDTPFHTTILTPPYPSAEYATSDNVDYIVTVREGSVRMYSVPGDDTEATNIEVAINVLPPLGAVGISDASVEVLCPHDDQQTTPPTVTLSLRYRDVSPDATVEEPLVGSVTSQPPHGESTIEIAFGGDTSVKAAVASARLQFVVMVEVPPGGGVVGDAILLGPLCVKWTK